MDSHERPFRVTHREGVLYLTLDTPRCGVNIFSDEAATQLLETLETVQVGKTRAVVIRSAKPDSFINGAGLLMAAMAVKKDTGTGDLTRKVRAAYHAVRDCPVPTIAAVEGNCYGCGMELTLYCDYRIGADTAVTHFYMTEINDYLFLPNFEGTLRLPLLVGIEAAAGLLLWGERWSARRAKEGGLVDAVFDSNGFAGHTERFVEQLLRETRGHKPAPRPAADAQRPPEDLARIVAGTRARIHRLPPAYHEAYGLCFDLMVRAISEGRVTEAGTMAELEAAGLTSSAPMAKRALSFFFIRQTAHQRSTGSHAGGAAPLTVAFAGDSEAVHEWHAILADRKLVGVDVLQPNERRARSGDSHVVSFVDYAAPSGRTGEGPQEVAMAMRPSEQGCQWPTDTVLLGPFALSSLPLLELAVREQARPGDRLVYQYLARAGFRVVLSRPRKSFVLQECLVAYFAPLVRYLLLGGSMGALNGTLRQFGFSRWPKDIIGCVGVKPLATWLTQALSEKREEVERALEALGRSDLDENALDTALLDALSVSLLAGAARWQTEKVLSHPSLVDLVAREAIDFPLQHGSLLTYFTRSRTRELVRRKAHSQPFVPAQDMVCIEALAHSEREAYL